jgi:hypothetical protein
MDLVLAPSEETPVKSPVVEVEAVDLAEQVNAETVAVEEASSEYETDSDDSEGWEVLSNGDNAIQLLRDEQLRDGLGMSLRDLTFVLTPDIPAIGIHMELGLTLCSLTYSSRCLHPG